MKKIIATLSTIVALSAPVSAEAILGVCDCIEKLPVTIEVQPGDTLIGIARANYNGDSSRYLDIARYNNIQDSNKIKVGLVLELPGKTYEHWRPFSVTDHMVGNYCNLYR